MRDSVSSFIFTPSIILWAFYRIESPIQVPQTRSTFHPHRTTKRFPSSRCASTIQIVRPLESIAETQP
jgi:hypothetical protein